MFINPVNTAELSAYVKSSGYYYEYSRITDRYDNSDTNPYLNKITNQSIYSSGAPISRSQYSFKNQFEKAKKYAETDDSLKAKKDRNKQEKSSNQVNSQSGGFVLTVPEEHLRKLQDYKEDLQQKIYNLFNSSPGANLGTLVDVTA
jgi:hypothetical protein